MKLCRLSSALVCTAAIMLFTGQAVAEGEAPPTDAELLQAVDQAAKTTSHHKTFKSVRGRYEQTIKWWRAPGAPADESVSLADAEWILGQRFMKLEFEGKWLGKSFQAVLLLGYDNTMQQYTAVWMDTLGTRTLMANGAVEEGGSAIAYNGEYVDPTSGGTVKFRGTLQMPDKKGGTKIEMYRTAPDGTEYKFLDADSKRKVMRGA